MQPDDRIKASLWDMRDAAKEINEFMSGVKFAKFEKDKLMRYAAERLLLIIGEAANHLSPQFRKAHPEISWDVFIRFRNILAHEYGESLLNRVWLAATESVPELIKSLDGLLPDEQE
ncbi:MAG TPA: HepT-like ribonuclease domain-containing protein [Acidobacteriota bacterium]|nr:HepT-like ribonuclease domain-containing protein [Acidobacteriota bacterium]